jgi:hypothetical protein
MNIRGRDVQDACGGLMKHMIGHLDRTQNECSCYENVLFLVGKKQLVKFYNNQVFGRSSKLVARCNSKFTDRIHSNLLFLWQYK